MAYGTVKVDNITFTNGGVDQTVTVSGIVQSISGNITATGTIQGATIIGTSTVSGATVTGNVGVFTYITGGTAGFTTVTGATVTGTAANFVTVSGTTVTGTTANFGGVITAPTIRGTTTVSGATITGTAGQFTTVTGGSAGFTTVTGATVTGTTANFTTLSGTTITGGHVTTASGTYTGNVTAAAFVPTGSSVPTNGVYLPSANNVAISTNGNGALFIDASGNVGVGVSPSARLEINGESRFTRSGASTQYVGIIADGTDTRIVAEGSSKNLLIKNNSTTSSAIFFDQAVASVYVFQQAGTERFRIRADGTFEIKGGGTAGISPAVSVNPSASANSLVIDSSGRVGLGTSSADNKLSVGIASADEGIELKATYNGARVARFALLNPGVDNTPYIGSVTGNDFGFITSGTRRMTLTAGGSLGIGTTSPSYKLDVTGGGIGVNTSGGTAASILFNQTGIGVAEVGMPASENALTFKTWTGAALTERARIDSSGRLLVGTSSARGNFFNTTNIFPGVQVENTGNGGGISIVRQSDDNGGAYIPLCKSRGTAVGDNTLVSDGDDLGALFFMGSDGAEFVAGAGITGQVDGTPGANDMPGRLVFSVTADGSASPTEALRISSNRAITVSDGGNVVLGTTTGTKIGTATSQKIGFYNATPVVQPTTGVAEAAFVENSGGTAVNVDSTFGGYTIQQVVQALQTLGLLA